MGTLPSNLKIMTSYDALIRNTLKLSLAINALKFMGARRLGKEGHLPHLEFEKNDVICCRPTKYPKNITRAYGARKICPMF